jgi:Type II secretion system (T2SS), protein N
MAHKARTPVAGSAGSGRRGDAPGRLPERDRCAVAGQAHCVESATGNLQVAGVVLPIPTSGPQLAPAAYQVTFAADGLKADEPLTGDVKDSGGPLEIAGKVRITPPRSYELNGTAKPRPDAPPEVQNALQMLGPATPDGGHTLSIAGSF